MKNFWHNLSFFWKVYSVAVALMVAVVLLADLTEDFVPYLVSDRKGASAHLGRLLDEYTAAPEEARRNLREQMHAEGVWVMDVTLEALVACRSKAPGECSVLDVLPKSDDWTTEWTMVETVLPEGRLVALGKAEPWFYDALEWVMWFLMIAVFAGGSCYYLTVFLTSRLRRITGAARRIAAGDLSVRVPVDESGGDEIAYLARSFNNMAKSIENVLENERRLLYDISHELRSPLARMHLALDLAGRSGPDKSGEYYSLLHDDIQRMSDMVEGIMEQGKAAAAMNDLLEPLDMRALLREVVELANFELRHGDRDVRCSLAGGAAENDAPLCLRGSRGQLEQALYNVLSNAMRYAPARSRVEVTAERLEGESGRLVVEVRDFGPGVPEDFLEKLFKPFFRVENARDKASGGVGLGLALARSYIQRHHGNISACNAGPGLKVIITLPLLPR